MHRLAKAKDLLTIEPETITHSLLIANNNTQQNTDATIGSI